MKIFLPVLLGIIHALNDFFSGYLLAVYSNTFTISTTTGLLLLYGALAFGGQIPVALWLNKHPNYKQTICLALVLLIVSAALSYGNYPIISLVLMGIASALIHVAGGTWVLTIAPNQTGLTGVFVGPGIAGLSLGGVLGSQALLHIPIYTLVTAIILLIFIWKVSQKYVIEDKKVSSQISPEFESHDALMLIILVAICIRSLIWDIVNIFYVGRNYTLLLSIGLSAFSGKIMGGFISDALGWKRWLLISLPAAALLLSFFGNNAITLCIGVALLQSTTPIMVKLMYGVLPREPAIAIAMSLGLGILLAGLPTFLPFFIENIYVALIFLCFTLPFYGWWLIRRL